MRKILLTRNQVALVDDDIFEYLNQWRWYALKNSYGGYMAVRQCYCLGDKKQYTVLMHRQIMSCPQGKEIDHRDHNTLNNWKSNLRICTRAENQRNRVKSKNNMSGYKGVGWNARSKKWMARITFNKNLIYLGLFDSEIKAAKIYDNAAKLHFGEFAKLNFG